MRVHVPRKAPISLICLACLLSCAGVHAEQATRSHHAFLLGGDISALAKIEELNGSFSDAAGTADLITILSRHGCNCARLRLFVDPNQENIVVNDLAYTLSLAKRVQTAGQSLLLDFHYSDTWADPGRQSKPAAWRTLSFNELERQVRQFTADAIGEFSRQGVLPEIVQIGNEVTNGILWPEGKIQYDQGTQKERQSWNRFCRLLKAGIDGVESTLQSGQQVKIMIHIDRGGDWQGTKYFFDRLAEEGVAFDMIGQSYYPWWHGTLNDLKANLEQTAKRYGKPIVVVETGYPHGGEQWKSRPHMKWPISPKGQAEFLRDVVQTVRATPNGVGAGVLYWYPEAIPVDGLHVWEGGSVALFSQTGELLPAIKAFQRDIGGTSGGTPEE